jgi:hypothetical protein
MNFMINKARFPRCTVAGGYGIEVAIGVGIASLIASTAMGVSSAQQAASAREDAARYQAAVAENNATLAKNNASLALQTGEKQVQESQEAFARKMGGIITAESASGVDTGFGTAVRLQSDTAKLGESDILTIRNLAQNKAISFINQEGGFNAQSSLYGNAASNARTAGYLEMGGSLASGTAKVSDKWKDWQTPATTSASTFGSMNPEGF